jgi:DNA-binding response OmpR family regulator
MRALGTTSILVAEDDPDILLLVQVALARAGYQVVPVADGLAALEIAVEQRPSLAILDVALPGLDGLSVLDRLRADSRTTAMLIVLLSASVAEKQILEGLRRGANSYVKTPFAVGELVAAVAGLIGRPSVSAPL